MKNTNFINSSGLEEGNDGNISTVYDMALLSSYAIKNDTYRKIVGTKNIITTAIPLVIANSDKSLIVKILDLSAPGLGIFTSLYTRVRELVWIFIGVGLVKIGNKKIMHD